MSRYASFLILLAAPAAALAQSAAVTDDVIARIKSEGMDRSQVMATLSYLSDVIGPRLTGSPNMRRANEWTKDKMAQWSLQNAHLEPWGPFGRGWSLERFSAQVVSPQDIPLIAFPKAWSPGLRAPYTGDVVLIDATDEAGLAKYHGHLRGAIVLNAPIRELKAHFEPQGTRYTDAELLELANRAAAAPRQRPGRSGTPAAGPGGPRAGGGPFALNGRRYRFYQDEGVALVVDAARGDDGTIFVQSATVPPPAAPVTSSGTPGAANGPSGAGASGAGQGTAAVAGSQPTGGQPDRPGVSTAASPRRFSAWDRDAPKILPQVVVASEQYNRLVRMLQQGEKLRMNVDLAVRFHDRDLMGYNTIAEIPGTDLKDELVMLGAHMDSWHSGTGATDNGAGCAVCMEAVRILKALNLQPRRTIRVALWSGEEEGLLGSHAYVAQHFGTRGANGEIARKPEYETFSSYFNLDNGTGKVRGIYLQGNEALRPIFSDWLLPFNEMGASTVTIANTGGTDHQSFDGVGLPGFQFIQDEIEYDSRTHHSNQDVFDRAQADDLKQASVIMASFVYRAAMLDTKLPRKPLPVAPRAPATN